MPKSDKASFIIYEDLECIIKNIDGCKNYLENSSTTKVSEHIPKKTSMMYVEVKFLWKIFVNTQESTQ